MTLGETPGGAAPRVSRLTLDEWGDEAATSLRRLLSTSGLLVVTDGAGLDDLALAALLGAVDESRPTVGRTRPTAVGLRGPGADGARFSDQHRAFATLPPELRAWLIGRRVGSTRAGGGGGATRTSTQPIFRRHPFNGRIALHLPAPGDTGSISGLPDEVAAATIAGLARHATRDENLLRPDVSADDVVVWDSWSVRLALPSGLSPDVAPQP